MVKLRWLKMKAFRSFVEETPISFPDSGFVLIRGANPGNHDSSGSGKTTILLAISYALDICPLPASELQSWLTEEKLQVELGLSSPQGDVVIARGKQNSITVNGQVTSGAKAMSAKLFELFKADPDTLQAITYRPQGKPGVFLSLTDLEKKEFLVRVLGLQAIEHAIEGGATRLAELENSLQLEQVYLKNTQNAIEILEKQPQPVFQAIEPLYLEREDIRFKIEQHSKVLEDLQKQEGLVESEIQSDAKLNENRKILKACEAQLLKLSKAEEESRAVFRAKQSELRERLRTETKRQSDVARLNSELQRNQQQLAALSAGNCNTCNRPWNLAQEKTLEIAAQIQSLKAQIASIPPPQTDEIEAELSKEFVPDARYQQMQVAKTKLELAVRERLEALRGESFSKLRDSIQQEKSAVAQLEGRLQGLTQQIKSAEQADVQLKELVASRASTLADYRQKLSLRQVSVDKLQAERNAEKDFQALLGRDGFLGVIFDEVLREITLETNARLGRLANVSHVTIDFRSEHTTGKGTVNRTITPVVYVGGQEAKLRSGLSGGMFTSVEGAVDLALMEVIQRRTGSVPGFLLLDETFDGQGAATKEAALEILKEHSREKLVLVIDHNSEFKELFSQFIDVVCENGTSRLDA